MFHARLVFYSLRAHPMHNSDVAEVDWLLIRHFMKGLACEETKKRTLDCRPRTMAEALKEAENVWGTQLLLSDDLLKGQQTILGPGCTELNERTKGAGLHMGPHVYHQVDRGGLTTVPILNLTDRAITLCPGLGLGMFEHTSVEEVATKWPGPVTAKQKKEEYLRQLVVNSKSEKKRPTKKFNADNASPTQREAWLIRTFEVKNKPCLAKPRALKSAKDLLMKYWDLFSHDGSYGHTNLIQHRIITEDVPPIKCRYPPINLGLEPALHEQLDEWLKHDVIEPADSPWSSNLVAVKKKGGKIRWCVNWRWLNEVTKKDSWPMPTVQDTIAQLAGSDVFSGVDMAGAFHCVEVHPEDREKTAFAMPFRTFPQKRLGFGVTNGPATYCRLVDKVLKDVPHTEALSFVDDRVVHSAGLDQHLKNLDKTLNAYCKAGLKLAPHKCSFFAPQITYLSHIVDRHRVRPVDSYVKAVRDWALLKYKTEARAFLGIVRYYRQHIKDYAELARPWTDITGKEANPDKEKRPIVVTAKMRKAFESLKEALTTAPVLGFPYFAGPKAGQFILDTDFCQTQTAGILSQVQRGREVLIAYRCKKLNKSQRNYPSTKGKLYAGIMWMDKYQYDLQHGPTFKWRTDNVALRHVQTMEPKGAIVKRWLDMLATYDFEVEHRTGTKHTNADALSRAGCLEPVDPEGETGVEEVQVGRTQLEQARDLSIVQEEDRVLSCIRDWGRRKHHPTNLEVRELQEEGASYIGFLANLEIGEDRVLRRQLPAQAIEPGKRVPCIPESLKEDVIQVAHVQGGHMRIGMTVHRLKGRVYFPGMKAEVEDYIKECPTCQKKVRKGVNQRHTLVSPTARYPFQRLHIDLEGPLNQSSRSRAKYILTCRDAFLKWPEAFSLKEIDALTIVKTLEKEIFARYGYPEAIHSDQGPKFMARLFKQLQPQLGINVMDTTGYNTKGNSQVERMHQDLNGILRALTTECNDPFAWEDLLPQALFVLKTAVCRSTGLAPYQILFGRECSTPIDAIFRFVPPEKTIGNLGWA